MAGPALALTPPEAAIFDLGGVLVDWDPRYLYQDLIPDPRAREDFLATVCTMDWHDAHDRGVPMAENAALLIARHPDKADLIRAWDRHWARMFAGPIRGAVRCVEALKARGVAVYLLSNVPAEKMPWIRKTFPFLDLFDDLIISAQEGVSKPDPRLFAIAAARAGRPPQKLALIDDKRANVAQATALGFHAHLYRHPDGLRRFLVETGLLGAREAPPP